MIRGYQKTERNEAKNIMDDYGFFFQSQISPNTKRVDSCFRRNEERIQTENKNKRIVFSKINYFLFILSVLVPLILPAQVPDAIFFADSITAGRLKKHVYYLASPQLEGRKSGEKGQKLAALYIREEFRNGKVSACFPENDSNAFHQNFNMISLTWKKTSLSVNGFSYPSNDYIYYSEKPTEGIIQKNLLFAGYATPQELEGLDFQNNAVMLLADNMDVVLKRIDSIHNRYGSDVFFIGFPRNDHLYNTLSGQYFYAFSLHFGGKGDSFLSKMQNLLPDDVHVFFLSDYIYERILQTGKKDIIEMTEIKRSGKGGFPPFKTPAEIRFKSDFVFRYDTFHTENIVGYIEGKNRKNEAILITAHYDHIGIEGGEIHPGADDNASGTAAVIEIAKAFGEAYQKGFRPECSLFFVAFTAEELGLIGSKYMADHPLHCYDSIKFVMNMDMIGRDDRIGVMKYIFLTASYQKSRTAGSSAKTKPNSKVYLYSNPYTSRQTIETMKTINSRYTRLKLDMTPGVILDKLLSVSSDHYSFTKKKIPATIFNTGMHKDLHQPTDTPDKLNYDKMERVARLVFLVAWEMAVEK